MKKYGLLAAGIVLVIGLVWVGVERHGLQKKGPTSIANNPNVLEPRPAPPPPPPLLTSREWVTFREAREKALRANPALQSEYRDILRRAESQEASLDAAMVKADPKMAPLVAQLTALRALNSAPQTFPHPVVSGKSGQPPVSINLSPADWQKIRTARAQAMQFNPEFSAEAKKQDEAKGMFEDKMDAAVLKADPQMAPLIAKFEAGRHLEAVAANVAAPK